MTDDLRRKIEQLAEKWETTADSLTIDDLAVEWVGWRLEESEVRLITMVAKAYLEQHAGTLRAILASPDKSVDELDVSVGEDGFGERRAALRDINLHRQLEQAGERVQCPVCNGKGEVMKPPEEIERSSGVLYWDCPRCKGSGRIKRLK